MDPENFDRRQERNEDREEEKFSAELATQELSSFKAQRCCVFLSDDEGLLHGRLVGMLAELDSLIIRDLRPGREALMAKQLIPYDNIRYICMMGDRGKCQKCRFYAELVEECKDAEKAETREPRGPSGDPGGDGLGGAEGSAP